MTTDDYVEPDIMTWFPRREDYEDKPEIKPDENYEDKLQRLLETIEAAQNSIKEVVDGNTCTLEHKVYRVMDVNQDMDDILKLQKECENDAQASGHQDTLKKARIGFQNLKVFINQVDPVEFCSEIRNEFLFKVGSAEGFGPWLDQAEERMKDKEGRPKSYDEALDFEQKSCLFLKEIVKGNKVLKKVQEAAEGIRGNVQVQEEFSKLSERYYVLCKKADARVKNVQGLLREWKALDDILAPTKPEEMDDLQVKFFLTFLHTYAGSFA